MRNLGKYGLGFQVEANTNCMNLIFVFQDHELTLKPRTSFQATLSLYMNLDENCTWRWVVSAELHYVQDVIKTTTLEPIS